MNPFAKYAIDRGKEREGILVEVLGMKFRIRSMTAANRAWRYALALAASKRREEIKTAGNHAFDIHEDCLIEAAADSAILGWEDVEGPDGQPFPFNRENCIELMSRCPQVWDRLREIGIDEDHFRDSAAEDGAKLGESSAGS